jgi:C-terminal processing protease CtpA/Prc
MITDSNEKGIKKLIIDLRNNNGGSENICLQLLYYS